MAEAPRRVFRALRGSARGALLALVLVGMAAIAHAQAVLSGFCGPVFEGVWHICDAEYAGPTTRYPHGVLGDEEEWGTLQAVVWHSEFSERSLSLALDADHVFEDLAPRLADLSLDGQAEIITIRSHQNLGAQLAIYRPDPDNHTFELIATTPYIGRSNRWLAPIGIADFNDDGLMDIAYVDRPHLARILRVLTFEDGTLREIANAGGFSNHRIGEDFITGGIRNCGAGPEMILADASWQSVMVARISNGAIEADAVARFSPQAIDDALNCR